MSRVYTSRKLRTIAYLWISFPLSYLIYAVAVLALNFSGLVKVVLSPWYWFVGAITAVAGFGILRIRWYGWYLFIFSNLLIAYETALDLVHYSVGDIKVTVFFMTVFFQCIAIFLVGREIRVPYFFPRIRWWESDPRYKLSVQAKIIRADKTEVEGEIMDISLGGCFVKSHSYFTPDEAVAIDFTLFDHPMHVTGHVVWRTESMVTHPKGIGVKFDTISKENSIYLKQATKKLRKLARVYNQIAREKNWQDYLQRERRYQGRNKK